MNENNTTETASTQPEPMKILVIGLEEAIAHRALQLEITGKKRVEVAKQQKALQNEADRLRQFESHLHESLEQLRLAQRELADCRNNADVVEFASNTGAPAP